MQHAPGPGGVVSTPSMHTVVRTVVHAARQSTGMVVEAVAFARYAAIEAYEDLRAARDVCSAVEAVILETPTPGVNTKMPKDDIIPKP